MGLKIVGLTSSRTRNTPVGLESYGTQPPLLPNARQEFFSAYFGQDAASIQEQGRLRAVAFQARRSVALSAGVESYNLQPHHRPSINSAMLCERCSALGGWARISPAGS
eukprot:1187349-Prorocentrum_minimum.AAC.1